MKEPTYAFVWEYWFGSTLSRLFSFGLNAKMFAAVDAAVLTESSCLHKGLCRGDLFFFFVIEESDIFALFKDISLISMQRW